MVEIPEEVIDKRLLRGGLVGLRSAAHRARAAIRTGVVAPVKQLDLWFLPGLPEGIGEQVIRIGRDEDG